MKPLPIVLAPVAVEDLKRLRAFDRAHVKQEMEKLRQDPTHEGSGRIKRLRGLRQPQYRLRVGDRLRVFYDVTPEAVEVLAIVSKQEVPEWLEREGKKS